MFDREKRLERFKKEDTRRHHRQSGRCYDVDDIGFSAGPCPHHRPGRDARGSHAHRPPRVMGRRVYHSPRRFLMPGLLLLLAEEPSHGYALNQKLVDSGFIETEIPGPMIYRALRHLEEDGLAEATQTDETGPGPARKVYCLTERGFAALDEAADQMGEIVKVARLFLERYEKVKDKAGEASPTGDGGD